MTGAKYLKTKAKTPPKQGFKPLNGAQNSMDGDEGTDEHYGSRDNDFLDAADSQTPGPTDAPAVEDCGSGFDDAQVLPSDIVRDNCENVFAPRPPRRLLLGPPTKSSNRRGRPSCRGRLSASPPPRARAAP